jgi:hypothetical protein
LRANLNTPTLHAQIADTPFSSTLITYLVLEGRFLIPFRIVDGIMKAWLRYSTHR